jgi:hypothetical protein
MWIVDDMSPLRYLTPQMLSQEAAFVAARPVQQRIEASGGAPTGSASFVGDNPSGGAVITYYQRTRHLFGKLKIEVLDANGTVIDELASSSRRGLNRVVWSMHLRPPRVPPAAQVSQAGTQGPRVMPGTYTIRMQKNGQTYDTTIVVGLDQRVKWTLADRRAQFEATMKVYTLFNDESALFERIAGLREQIEKEGEGKSARETMHRRLEDFDAKLDGLRKKIVATTEGGAITGEERLREHTDQLYGALASWDGPPSAYQLDNVTALRAELTDLESQFAQLTAKQLPALNQSLRNMGLPGLSVPPPTAFDDEEDSGSSGGRPGGRSDPDAAFGIELPKIQRLWN